MSFGIITEPWWDDRDVWIVGGGPSLRGRDLSQLFLRGYVVGVNRAADDVLCDATYTMDVEFLRRYADRLAAWAEDHEVYATVPEDWFKAVNPHGKPNLPIPGVTYLHRVQGFGAGDRMDAIVNGLNSGYGALCLALKKRGGTNGHAIYLLGFDLRGDNDHWHDGYAWGSNSSAKYFRRWADRFQEIADELPRHARVVNCNPDSAVGAFEKVSYESVGL